MAGKKGETYGNRRFIPSKNKWSSKTQKTFSKNKELNYWSLNTYLVGPFLYDTIKQRKTQKVLFTFIVFFVQVYKKYLKAYILLKRSMKAQQCL